MCVPQELPVTWVRINIKDKRQLCKTWHFSAVDHR